MKKEEIIRDTAKELEVPLRTVKPVINTFLNIVMASLLNGDDVLIRGFGTFKNRHLNGGRQMINVHTGERIITKPSDKVVFVQSKKFGVRALR